MKKLICSLILSLSLFSALFAEVDFKFGWPLTIATATSISPDYKGNSITGNLGFDLGYTIEGKKHFGFTSEFTYFPSPIILPWGFNVFVGGAYSIPINEKSRVHFDAGYALCMLGNDNASLEFGGRGIQINTSYNYFFNNRIGLNIGIKNSLLFMNQAVTSSYKYPESSFGDFYIHSRKNYNNYISTCTYEISPSIGLILRFGKSTKKDKNHEE